MGVLAGVFTAGSASIGPPQKILIPVLPRTERPDPNPNCTEASRRAALFLLSFPAITAFSSTPYSASAFSISITGPKEWLRDQKKKAARFVLAPIDASRQILSNAYLVLDSESPPGDSQELRKMLNSAARDCVSQDRSSFVTFQASTGVEVCTFKLIVKNAASLLDDIDPLKLEAETRLDDLIRSFSFLGDTIDSSDLHMNSDRDKVKMNLMQSISALDKFEQGVKNCLGV